MHDSSPHPTKAFLVSIEYPNDTPGEAQSLLEELIELVHTLQLQIVGSQLIKLKFPHHHFLLGSGKAEEITTKAKDQEAAIIIFDNELSPAQQRNWEKLSGLRVIDRNEVILDIFAQKARTKEASLQVELARLEYMLPRLKRAWTHLSRQRGGGVTQRGEGETQLEIDQRLVRQKITQLKEELAQVIQHRSTQRKRRMKIPIPSGAIVGYTNAGKSSLLNTLTGAQTIVEDKLFATLDPTTRKLHLPQGQTALLTDTVGFVRRLPHRLVEAFKATLEEAVVSDFLIHLIDISNPCCSEHFKTTNFVLEELNAKQKSTIIVFNKIDLLYDPIILQSMKLLCPDAILISTKTHQGIPLLLERIQSLIQSNHTYQHFLIPHNRYDLISLLHAVGSIQSSKAQEEGMYFTAAIPIRWASTFSAYNQTSS